VPVVGDAYDLIYTLGSTCASVDASNPGALSPTGNSGGLPLAGNTGPAAALAGGASGAPGSSAVTGSSGQPLGSSGTAPPAPPASSGAAPPATGRAGQAAPVATAAVGPLTSRHIWTLYLAVVLALLVGAGVQLRPLSRAAPPPGPRPPSNP
jgi:hypothetical protein